MANVELQQIGPYSITRLLSASSTISFYLGKLPQRKKDVLIQVLHTPLTTPETREAFLARAKQLKRLGHRNIIKIDEAGFQDVRGHDCGYLIMEYVVGRTFRQYLPSGERVERDKVRQLLSSIADTLQYTHAHGVVHGNINPDNLLRNERNETLITNFSFVLFDPTFVTHENATIPYMAPEHLRGTPTAASDQYSLAVMVYEWLCGQRPYTATNREELLHQQEHEAIPAPRSLNDAISPAVERVLLQALTFNLDDRFQFIKDFADSYLHSLMGTPINTGTRHPTASLSPKPMISQPLAINLPNNAHKSDSTLIDQSQSAVDTPVARLHNRQSSAKKLSDSSSFDELPENEQSQSSPLQEAIPQQERNVDKEHSLRLIQGKKTNRETPSIPIPLQPKLKIIASSSESSRLHSVVTADLEQGGVLSKSLPGYEERPAQVEMATLVAETLTDDIPAIIEASTGTGKSYAYLIPIVRSGKVAIISTANKALQEQLFYKDIPFVQQHIKDFGAALVKGMGNYVCLDRFESERNGLQFYTKNPEFMRLLKLTEDPDSSFTGDFETLGFPLPGDIRGRVSADGDQCAWSKCSFFADCYVRKMRTKAEQAQIIVVNHTLLLLDAAMDGYLLPERDVIIIDEAHHLEEEASRSFTITISPTQINSLLAQHLLKEHSASNLQFEVDKAMTETWERLRFMPDIHFKGRVNLQESVEEGLHLSSAIEKLGDSLRKERPKDLPEKESTLYDKLLKRTQNLADNVRIVFSVDQPNRFVYYVERENAQGQRGGYQLQVSAAPLDVTIWLRERLFDKCNVICTSATLATIGSSGNAYKSESKGANFAYFRSRVGLDLANYPEVLESILPLTFDYESNALLYVPRHLPEPAYGDNMAAENYALAIAREMYKLVKCSRGRAFLLFSSKRMLDKAYELMSPHLEFPLLRQGDMSRIELTRRFREEEGAVLFGLKSFWEGVDIAGDALSLVVIDKLPFEPPDDPVHEARVAQMKAAGENWFGTYVLPQAVLRLKQGLGRLLRTREDRGVMAILDTRLHTKGYGKQVLNALPPARRTSSIKDVEQFFTE